LGLKAGMIGLGLYRLEKMQRWSPERQSDGDDNVVYISVSHTNRYVCCRYYANMKSEDRF
jgi:hypothetical protein